MGSGIDSRNRYVAEAELAPAPAKAAHRSSLSERAGAPSGAQARSRPKGAYRNLRGPSAAAGWSPVGAANEGQPQDVAPRMGVGPLHTIGEVAEGNEAMEKRERQERITMEQAKGQTQRWQPLLPNLRRVNEAARRSGQTRFTALLHHVDVAALERAFWRQRRTASPGVDRVRVNAYEQTLASNLQRLHERVHSGQYWPKPVRRAYIPKSDGGLRSLGIPALEDKIVQGAVAEVLNAVYEADFVGFSHGFRPGRSPHSALAALEKALMTQRVNWVLDLDIRTFFDRPRLDGSDAEAQDGRSSDPPLDRAVAQSRPPGGRPMGTSGGWNAARVRNQSDLGERLPPLRRRPMGAPMATQGSRAGNCLQICR